MVNTVVAMPPISRPLIATFSFLAGSSVVLLLVIYRYLLPAMAASHGVDERGRKQLAAISALVLILVLVILLGILILVVKPGRLFMPRKSPPRTRTHYPDAWEESARRTPTPPPEAME
jgi:hypothetical protein